MQLVQRRSVFVGGKLHSKRFKCSAVKMSSSPQVYISAFHICAPGLDEPLQQAPLLWPVCYRLSWLQDQTNLQLALAVCSRPLSPPGAARTPNAPGLPSTQSSCSTHQSSLTCEWQQLHAHRVHMLLKSAYWNCIAAILKQVLSTHH